MLLGAAPSKPCAATFRRRAGWRRSYPATDPRNGRTVRPVPVLRLAPRVLPADSRNPPNQVPTRARRTGHSVCRFPFRMRRWPQRRRYRRLETAHAPRYVEQPRARRGRPQPTYFPGRAGRHTTLRPYGLHNREGLAARILLRLLLRLHAFQHLRCDAERLG